MNKLLLVLALAACHQDKHGYGTFGYEDGGMIVEEYRASEKPVPDWVFRLDLSKTGINAANDTWTDDGVLFQLGGAHGEVDTKLHLSITDDTFTIDGASYAASAGRVITIPVDDDGNLGPPAQSSLDAYHSPRPAH